jgi:hypothetical protein
MYFKRSFYKKVLRAYVNVQIHDTWILHESEASIGKEKLLNLKKSDASCSKAVHFRAMLSASGGCFALNNQPPAD